MDADLPSCYNDAHEYDTDPRRGERRLPQGRPRRLPRVRARPQEPRDGPEGHVREGRDRAVRLGRRLPRLRVQLPPARPLRPHPRGHPPAEEGPLARREVHVGRGGAARRRGLRLEARRRLLPLRPGRRAGDPRGQGEGVRVLERRHDQPHHGRRDGPAVHPRPLVRRHRRLRALRRQARSRTRTPASRSRSSPRSTRTSR